MKELKKTMVLYAKLILLSVIARRRYVLDTSKPYGGRLCGLMPDGRHHDKSGKTLKELNRIVPRRYRKVTVWELYRFKQRQKKKMEGPFVEISPEHYWYLALQFKPYGSILKYPVFWSELPVRYGLHEVCFRKGNKYYKGMRDPGMPPEKILAEIEAVDKGKSGRLVLLGGKEYSGNYA